MSNPEVVSVDYQDILARTFVGTSGGFRHDIVVSPEARAEFLETLTLEREKYPIAHVFFMVQSVVKLQHSPDILEPNSWYDMHGDQTEIMEGLCFQRGGDFVAVDATGEGTLFRPLSELVLESELPEYTVRNVLTYAANGHYRDTVSHALAEVIGQRARVNTTADSF